MPSKMRFTRHRQICTSVGAVLLVAISTLLATFLSGCSDDPAPEAPPGTSIVDSGLGSAGMRERVFDAAIIARVRLKGSTSTAEFHYTEDDGSSVYRGIVRFRFEVLEYLKGTGGNELVADATVDIKSEVIRDIMDRNARGEIIKWHSVDRENPYTTKDLALEAARKWEKDRDTRWDDREALVLVRETQQPAASASSGGSKRYSIGPIYDYGIDTTYRVWLPSSSSTQGGGVSSGETRFLLEPPGAASASASAATAQPATISVSELKAEIAKMDKWLKDGEGVEGYLKCVRASFFDERLSNGYKERGEKLYAKYDLYLGSGLPAVTTVEESHAPAGRVWFEGRDKDLFGINPHNNGNFHTKRPLPTDVYSVYHNYQDNQYVPCNYYPDENRSMYEWFVHVTAPAGVLHEAFFDPVDLGGGAVGADGSKGVLKPAAFRYNNGTTTIERIEWASNAVEIELDPHTALANHHADFIALDGTVSLRLDFDDASAVTEGGDTSLQWSGCAKPWKDGDLLMLRISISTTTAATNPAPCASASVATSTAGTP